MKCEDLKELLESNDEKNARIKANTIECFELVKDFVVDDLIQKSIESNFSEHGNYLAGYKIYGKLFEMKEISTELIFDMSSYSFGWEDYYRITYPLDFGGLDQNRQAEYTKNRLAIKAFFSEFDRSLFKNLVENHLRSCGFRNAKMKNIRGRLVETDAFYASRSTIEKSCCPDTKQAKASEEENSSIVFAIVIMVMVLIAASFIIF